MEFGRQKMGVALAIASVAALSILLATDYRRRRSRKLGRAPTSCYLDTMSKPQHSFKRLSTDNSYSPFNHFSSSASLHPYQDRIISLIEKPCLNFISCSPDQGNVHSAFKTLKDSYVWVGTESQLTQLALTLSSEKAFAVDTEQHSFRSFLGFTALMQISTETDDYLVDAIALHDAMEILRPVFADARVCKVFHGADGDVVWLQRDFHIYVVNLFDTAKACEVLSKPHKSLAYLLETYCAVAKNKLFQREDWRQRPLSGEMVHYARTDAHYLLYIARCLIAELKQHESEYSSCPDDKLRFVLEASRRSNMICMQLYSKEIEDSPGESAAFSILSRQLNGQGGVSSPIEKTKFQDLVRRLCAWRDVMARMHDESIRYVLSDHAIVALANRCPTTQAEIFSTVAQADLIADNLNFSPSFPAPSPLICCLWDDVLGLIQDNVGNVDDRFAMIIQRCLGPKGTCPLSIFNYTLLVNCNLKLTSRLVSKQNEFKYPKQVAKKASRELFIQKFSCKSPVYHNCRIFASDGRLLCYCDHRKLEWYLRRDLAKLIDDDPPAIILLFEPKGRPEDEGNDFYIQRKKNMCVGCGEGNHYLRYRIIPSCYRIHFPEHLKSHRSHDIVLLCVDCHEIAHAAAEKYKKQIADEFRIPLYVNSIVDSNLVPVMSNCPNDGRNSEDLGVSPLQLRTAAKALLRHGHEMPPSRCEELTQIVSRYYGGREISREDLVRALLVGMSPHEKRRLERKKGLPLSVLSDKELLNYNWKYTKQATTHNEDVQDVSLDISHGKKESKNTDFTSPLGFYDGGDKETVSAWTSIEKKASGVEVADAKLVHGFRADDHYVENILPSGCINSSSTRQKGNFPHKHNSKLSLLGHGPHGKKVVDHIVKEYGEEGICQFCQRWRQVFVEAVHPQFMPVGWDIMHSGRRQFGEFSVYNPEKGPAGGA